MRNFDIYKGKIDCLQEVIKIYLMTTGGSTTQLGGITCALVDVLSELCSDDCSGVSKRIDNISIGFIKIIYSSMIERLEGLDAPDVDIYKESLMRIESEVELLPHLRLLKSIIVGLSMATRIDYTLISQKLQELISVKP